MSEVATRGGTESQRQQVADILAGLGQPEPAEEPEVASEVEATAEETVVEEQAEETTEALAEVEGEESEAGEQPDGLVINTLSELASAIEVDNEFLYGIQVPIGDNGEKVSISQLKDTYKNRSDEMDAARATLEQERASFEQEKTAHEAQISTAMAQAQQMPEELMEAQAEMRAIQHAYNTYDWAELEKTDAGKTALLKQDLSMKYAQAQQKVSNIAAKIQTERDGQLKALRDVEERKLLTEVKDWTDPAVRNKETVEIRKLLADYKFAEPEIASLVDHRVLKLVRDYMLLKGQVSEAANTEKVVRKAPRVLKPGATKPAPDKRQKMQAQLDAAKKSRDNRVKTKAIGDLLALNNVRQR